MKFLGFELGILSVLALKYCASNKNLCICHIFVDAKYSSLLGISACTSGRINYFERILCNKYFPLNKKIISYVEK